MARRRTRKGHGTILGTKMLQVGAFEVQVTYKAIRNIHLRVKEPHGRVCVSAPVGTPDATIEQLVQSRAEWIAQAKRRIEKSPATKAELATDEEKALWKQVVSACVPALIEEWEPIMGVHPTTLAYRNMKSRWGSCQPSTGRICINTRLALYPPECLEYVVVHELCHLLEASHGPRFHKLMDFYMPDWRVRKEKLRA